MNIAQTLINLVTLSLCFGTAGGILLHETNTDKAFSTAVSSNATTVTSSTVKLGTDPHTHSERSSLYQSVRDLTASQPRLQPRVNEEREYVRGAPGGQGRHPFDDQILPMIA